MREGGNPWLYFKQNRKEVVADIGTPERVRPCIPCLGQRVMAKEILPFEMQRSMDYFHPLQLFLACLPSLVLSGGNRTSYFV